MTRLVLFCAFLTALIGVMNLRYLKNDIKVDNTRFDHKKQLAKVEAKEQMLAEFEARKQPKVEEESTEEVKEEFVLVLDTPELQNGAKAYKACIMCHGKQGEGKKSQNAPKLAGQHDWYLYDALVKMKSGERNNPIMNPYLKKLNDQDMKDVSLYLSKLQWSNK